jgi:hypothetical protein
MLVLECRGATHKSEHDNNEFAELLSPFCTSEAEGMMFLPLPLKVVQSLNPTPIDVRQAQRQCHNLAK